MVTFLGSNIRNRLKLLEEQISLSSTTAKQSTKRSCAVSTEKDDILDEPPCEASHFPPCEASSEGRPGRKRLCSDAAIIQRSITNNDEDPFGLSLVNPFDLVDTSFSTSEDFATSDAISSLHPSPLFGLQTPSESLDCVEINTLWDDVPHAQEFRGQGQFFHRHFHIVTEFANSSRCQRV